MSAVRQGGRLSRWMPWRRRADPWAALPRPASGQTAARVHRALLAVLDREWEEGERELTEAVRDDSDAVGAYLALARLYRHRGEIGRAIRIHQNLLLRPDLAPGLRREVLAELAADFQRGGFLRRAIASYDEVLAHESHHRTALRAMVRLCADVREWDRAIACARRLARLEGRDPAPEEAELLLRQAEALHAEGQNDEARKAVKRALRRDERSARGRVLLGELEAERGRSKAALAAWQAVPALDRSLGPEIYPRLAATYQTLGKLGDFESLLRRVLADRPDDVHARVALGRLLAARGATAEAVMELRRAVDLEPDDTAARVALGRLLLSEHRDAEALKAYGELLGMLEAEGAGGRRIEEALE